MKKLTNLHLYVLRGFVVCALSAVLAACVTTTESRFTKKASPEKAVENYTQLGLGYLQRGQVDLARARFKKALSIDDSYAPANDGIGLLWQTEGELDLAEESFEKAISNDSSFTAARHHLGRLMTQSKRYKEAVRHLKRAAQDREYERRASAHNDLAKTYYYQGDNDRAIDSYLEALRIKPYFAESLVNVSTLLFQAKRMSEASKYYNRFQRLVSRNQSQHTAHSLWLGIRVASAQRDGKTVSDLAAQLRQQFPDSDEYREYRNAWKKR